MLTHVNATLRTVDLSRNLIADEGARAFAAALKRNRVLTALDLSANGISEAGGTEILKALRRGKHGVVSCALGDNLLPEWMLAAADAACLSVALPARLKKAAPTAQLELVEARLLPSHAALLHDHAASAKPPLRALALRAAPLLGAAGLVALGWGKSALPHEPLSRGRSQLLPCPPLMRLPRPAPLRASRLSHLELAACNIDGDGAAVLALLVRDGSLPRLSSLALRGNRLGAGGGAGGGGFGGGGGESGLFALGAALSDGGRLRKLEITDDDTVGDAVLIEVLPSLLRPPRVISDGDAGLSELRLGGTEAADGAAACAAALRRGCALRLLALGDGVGDDGARRIARALAPAAGGDDDDDDDDGDDDDRCRLRRGHRGFRSSTSARAWATAARRRSRVLAHDAPMLQSLTLGVAGAACEVGARGAAALARMLRSNASLRTLNLGGSPLGERGCVLLCDALEGNTTLRRLLLAGCGAGLKTADALRRTLRSNWSLTEADLTEEDGGSSLPTLVRMDLAGTLEANRTQGKKRIDDSRRNMLERQLRKLLAELQPAFDRLAAGCGEGERRLAEWGADECGRFAANAGFPQYSAAFAFNLRGDSLAALTSAQLVQLGVRDHAHQRALLAALRELLGAEKKKAELLSDFRWDLATATAAKANYELGRDTAYRKASIAAAVSDAATGRRKSRVEGDIAAAAAAAAAAAEGVARARGRRKSGVEGDIAAAAAAAEDVAKARGRRKSGVGPDAAAAAAAASAEDVAKARGRRQSFGDALLGAKFDLSPGDARRAAAAAMSPPLDKRPTLDDALGSDGDDDAGVARQPFPLVRGSERGRARSTTARPTRGPSSSTRAASTGRARAARSERSAVEGVA